MTTIFALATVPGKSGVAVIRVSGPLVPDVSRALAKDVPPSHRASLRSLRIDGEIVDEALILFFPENRSFTGEPVLELHLHGSPAVVRRMLRYLGNFPGLRHAEAGEFTRRALENGRLDLAHVEGLGDLIEAETEMQRRQAMRVFSGQLSETVGKWREELTACAALMMASIDFSDEELPDTILDEIDGRLWRLGEILNRQLHGAKVSERVRSGFEVALIGAPNVGKSTLLNAIARREIALTSEIAGTTRDVLELRVDLGGLPVTFLDTAGIRSSTDQLERLGIDRARERALGADLRIFLRKSRQDRSPLPLRAGDIEVQAKVDLVAENAEGVSGLTGAGLELLLARIGDILAERASGAALITRERQRVALERSVGSLERVRDELRLGEGRLEFAAEALRDAIEGLDVLTGRIGVEDALGDVFSRFCIGK